MRYNGSGPESVTVDFSIIVSPTYRVPVLWFTLHQVSLNGLSGLDAVYQYLVPSLQKDGARNIGILGGISMAVWTFNRYGVWIHSNLATVSPNLRSAGLLCSSMQYG